MIPVATPDGSSRLPADASFWMPSPDEMDEEGIGYFRDTWLIADVAPSEAAEVIEIGDEVFSILQELFEDADATFLTLTSVQIRKTSTTTSCAMARFGP